MRISESISPFFIRVLVKKQINIIVQIWPMLFYGVEQVIEKLSEHWGIRVPFVDLVDLRQVNISATRDLPARYLRQIVQQFIKLILVQSGIWVVLFFERSFLLNNR